MLTDIAFNEHHTRIG